MGLGAALVPAPLLPTAKLGRGAAALESASDTRGLAELAEGVGEVTVGGFLTGGTPSFVPVVGPFVPGAGLGAVFVEGFGALVVGLGVADFAATDEAPAGTSEARLDAVVVPDVLGPAFSVEIRLPPTVEELVDGASFGAVVALVLGAVGPVDGVAVEFDLTGALVAVLVDGLLPELVPNVPELSTFLTAFDGADLTVEAAALTTFFASLEMDALGFDGDVGGSSGFSDGSVALSSVVVPFGCASDEAATGLVGSLVSASTLEGVTESIETSWTGSSVAIVKESRMWS